MSVPKAPTARARSSVAPSAFFRRCWSSSCRARSTTHPHHRTLLSRCQRWKGSQWSLLLMLSMSLSMGLILIKSSRKLILHQTIMLDDANHSSSSSSSSSSTTASTGSRGRTFSWGSLWSSPLTLAKSRHASDGALRTRTRASGEPPQLPKTVQAAEAEAEATPPNLHAHYPMVCDGDGDDHRDWRIHPSVPNYLDLVHQNREANAREHKQEFTVVGHYASSGRSARDLNGLARLQSCTYALLDDWNRLARRHSIQPWAAHGGSAIGAKCFGSMNPWDDDIDISIWDCSALDRLWNEGRRVNETYPDLPPDEYQVDKPHQSFEARLIENDLILLKGGRCCHWYKLKSVAQVRHKIKAGSDIVGLDLECMNLTTFENQVRKKAGWDAYMGNFTASHKVDTVMFGPTTIQVMPQPMNDKYIEYRYGKKDPCSFPFRSGQDPIPGLLATNHTTLQVDDSDGLLKYLPVIQEHQMHWVMANWYTSKVQRAMWLRRAMMGSTNERDKMYWQRQSIVGALNRVEVDSAVSTASCPLGAFDSESNRTEIQVLAFNAERGTHWDEWSELIRSNDLLSRAAVLVVSNVDVGMARSGNVHTVRRLALALGMNYAFAVEAIELTRGTRDEQEATNGQRDALGLNGYAILSKCKIVDPAVVRDDPLDVDLLSLPSGERRLGGRMTLLARVVGGGEGEGSASLVVGNSPKPLSNEVSRTKTMKFIKDSPALVVGGVDSNDDSSRFCEDLGLKVVVSGQVSASGCGLFGLPRLFPRSLCSNQPTTRHLTVPPCFGESRLGASALSSHAMATATLTCEGRWTVDRRYR